VKKDYLNPKAVFHSPYFTHTVAVSGAQKLVFVAGQVSYDASGKVVAPGDMRAQTEQVFESLTHNLKAAGAGWGDVVKINGYMVGLNPERLTQYRDARTRYLVPGKLPASTLVGVERLVHDDLLLEVEVIAAVAGSRKKTVRKKER
jgi:enamine deaminase RidA (YjgF/YER057c/UK114 family)